MRDSGSDEATLEDLQTIRLSRHKLERWCHEPFFDEIVKGCFVRIGIGEHRDRPVYLFAQIVRVTERSSYSLGRTRTRKALLLKHGKDERTMKMATVSDQPATAGEYDRWKEALQDNDFRMPNKKHVTRKVSDIGTAKEFNRTRTEVDKVISEKRRAGIHKGNTGARIQQLGVALDAYEEAITIENGKINDHNEDVAAIARRKVEELQQKMQTARKEQENIQQLQSQRQQKRVQTHASNVASINEKNYEENFRIRKARKEKKRLEKERRASLAAQGGSAEAGEAASDTNQGSESYHKVEWPTGEAASGTPGNEPPRSKRPSTQVMAEAHAGIDLDIDLDDLDVEIDDIPDAAAAEDSAPAGGIPRYGSALSQYKAKRGLI